VVGLFETRRLEARDIFPRPFLSRALIRKRLTASILLRVFTARRIEPSLAGESSGLVVEEKEASAAACFCDSPLPACYCEQYDLYGSSQV
jgi:hypothetical protein